MKILVYGDSNVWGYVPGSYDEKRLHGKQHPKDQRWTSVLDNQLSFADVVVDGLNGRTTAFDDTYANKPYRNGLRSLPEAIDKYIPIDLIVLALGINDLKIQQEKSVDEITAGMQKLIREVDNSKSSSGGNSPRVLVVAPQPIEYGYSSLYFDGCSVAKSHDLPAAYETVAIEEGADFLNSANEIASSKVDGIHLDSEEHFKLGCIVADKIKQLYPELV